MKAYAMVENRGFAEEISRIHPLIMREFARSQKNILSKGLLTIPQVIILDFLIEKGPAQMNQLARILNFTMSAVTVIVDKMVGLKLVKRERSSEDRRVVNVTILNKGKEVARQVRKAREDCANNLFSCLTQKDKTEYIGILKKGCT